MIDQFIELAKICDLKIIQEEAKDLSIKSIDDVKTYFVNKNIEISDKLANELLDRIDTNEMSISELETISAGTRYDDFNLDKCPNCGCESFYNDKPVLMYKDTIGVPFGDTYNLYQCFCCGHEFRYWINQHYADDEVFPF